MKTLVIIPAYNEERTIGRVLEGVIPLVDHVVVINDGSTDQTGEVAHAKGVQVLTHVINRGLGSALRTGFAYALSVGAETIVTLDADGQHSPEDVPRMIVKIMEGNEVVIATRMKRTGMPLHRRIANRIANIATSGGSVTSDSQSGLRAFRADVLSRMQLFGDRMEISSEIISEVSRLKLRVSEIEITPVYTTYSLSKGQGFFVGLATLWRLMLTRLLK